MAIFPLKVVVDFPDFGSGNKRLRNQLNGRNIVAFTPSIFPPCGFVPPRKVNIRESLFNSSTFTVFIFAFSISSEFVKGDAMWNPPKNKHQFLNIPPDSPTQRKEKLKQTLDATGERKKTKVINYSPFSPTWRA